MRMIDSHQHTFWLNRDDAGSVADLDEHGIEVAWLLSWEVSVAESAHDKPGWFKSLNPLRVRPDWTHPGIPFEDAWIAKRRYPDRFILGYCPHPMSETAVTLFETAVEMHGVRVCGEWKFRMLFDDPRCLELFRAAGRHKAPVVLHLDVPYGVDENGQTRYNDHRWYGGTVANLERALQACPETNFIGHAPGFWREISGDSDLAPGTRPRGPVKEGGRLYRLFDTYPNLYADLSASSCLTALERDPEHAKKFLVRFADRMLFGRDEFGGKHKAFLDTLNLPADVQQKIYFANANKLVPLPA